MRPAVIVESIHDHTIEARARRGAEVLHRTAEKPSDACAVRLPVRVDRTGFLDSLDIDRLEAAAARCGGQGVLRLPIGK